MRNPVRDIRVVRSIVDGRHVFLHAFQALRNGEARRVTRGDGEYAHVDIYRIENGLIAEHRDNVEPVPEGPQANSGKF